MFLIIINCMQVIWGGNVDVYQLFYNYTYSLQFPEIGLVIAIIMIYIINTLGSGRSPGHAPSSDSHIRASNAKPFKMLENPFRRNCFLRNRWKNSRCSGTQLSEATIKVGQTSACSPGEPSEIVSNTALNRSILSVDWV